VREIRPDVVGKIAALPHLGLLRPLAQLDRGLLLMRPDLRKECGVGRPLLDPPATRQVADRQHECAGLGAGRLVVSVDLRVVLGTLGDDLPKPSPVLIEGCDATLLVGDALVNQRLPPGFDVLADTHPEVWFQFPALEGPLDNTQSVGDRLIREFVLGNQKRRLLPLARPPKH
jgi:hypothetical protein